MNKWCAQSSKPSTSSSIVAKDASASMQNSQGSSSAAKNFTQSNTSSRQAEEGRPRIETVTAEQLIRAICLPGRKWCKARSYALHDPWHVFFKLPKPVDQPLVLQPPLPQLYKRPVGPADGVFNLVDLKGYLRLLTHTFAVCDQCMSHLQEVVPLWRSLHLQPLQHICNIDNDDDNG
ncbi:hypothetical protein L227DRAFT_655606 [Lentinus tigrinus ALCF2SS1-6]|uniref:Uncharacterized protein n=1 Tax=Lentinus tigrinus ALCF2SS1-6 TaxID=1328759 RepID=A0A5C2S181_9APHY|nr:hypothetical protein L227DRAFT_655606 [Lentinus tigrinus ALCF2SS1-6]